MDRGRLDARPVDATHAADTDDRAKLEDGDSGAVAFPHVDDTDDDAPIVRIVVGQGHFDSVRAFVAVLVVVIVEKLRRFAVAAQRERRFFEFPRRASPV